MTIKELHHWKEVTGGGRERDRQTERKIEKKRKMAPRRTSCRVNLDRRRAAHITNMRAVVDMQLVAPPLLKKGDNGNDP